MDGRSSGGLRSAPACGYSCQPPLSFGGARLLPSRDIPVFPDTGSAAGSPHPQDWAITNDGEFSLAPTGFRVNQERFLWDECGLSISCENAASGKLPSGSCCP